MTIYKDISSLARQADKDAKAAEIRSQFLAHLDEIRLGRAQSPDGFASFDMATTDDRYKQAFEAAGYDLLNLSIPVAANTVRTSPISNQLVLALDL